MKTLIILLSAILLGANCPTKGDSKRVELQRLDSLKNRQVVAGSCVSLPLDSIFHPGSDELRFSTSSLVKIKGYIVLVKYGGSETCNCHSKNKSDLDTHIEIAQTPTPQKGDVIICEINRFNKNDSISYTNVLKMKGAFVEITGYLFFDEEHKQNAINSNPKGTFLWRRSCWEVHPVFSVREIK